MEVSDTYRNVSLDVLKAKTTYNVDSVFGIVFNQFRNHTEIAKLMIENQSKYRINIQQRRALSTLKIETF